MITYMMHGYFVITSRKWTPLEKSFENDEICRMYVVEKNNDQLLKN